MIPYGRQSLDQSDIDAVVAVLQSDFLTTGPAIPRFEQALAAYVGAEHAVAVSSGTAALHAALHAIGIGPGDEVIVPPITFAATSNAVLYQGGTPVFADVDAETLLIDPAAVAAAVTPKTRAVIAVDYAGQPCDMPALRRICDAHGLTLITDGCHALGAALAGTRVGALADMTCFSFHPVKHITTGEGGMVTTANADWAANMRAFRTHGVSRDYRQREEDGDWFYAMTDLGYNYRITDIQCALGYSQLQRFDGFLARRQAVAARYDDAFADSPAVRPLGRRPDTTHAYHLYVIRVDAARRKEIFQDLRAAGIGVNVHYIPVHLHPYYRENLGTAPGLCPVAEAAYAQIISLPVFPELTADDQQTVIDTVRRLTT